MSKKVAQLLMASQVALHNALNDEPILKRLATYGYDAVKLEAGQALYQRVAELQQAVAANYGRQFAATDDFQLHWARARKTLNHQRRLARVAFREDREMRRRLALAGQPGRAFSQWAVMAAQFYEQSLQNNQIQNRLATVGLTAELLQAGQEQVTALLTAKSQQTQRVGNARQRTKERNQAVKTLRRWLRDFVEIARIAFAGDPPLLAKLGPLVTNPARRAATTPAPAPEREAAAAPPEGMLG